MSDRSNADDVVGLRWKHAASCHQGSTLDGESDVFVEDEIWKALGASKE